jgi:BON domain
MDTRTVLVGAAAGSALMFMLDPNNGRRRRALVRDKVVRAGHKSREGLDATARDVANRASGIAATARSRWSDEPPDEAVLDARVRSKLGRASSHPRAIEVEVHGGDVTLRGPVLAWEADDVLAAVRGVRGVGNIHDQLQRHETADSVPALQGQGRAPGSSVDILQSNWTPATRAMVGVTLLAGLCIVLNAARRAA